MLAHSSDPLSSSAVSSSSAFHLKEWRFTYDLLEDIRVHKNIPKIRFVLSKPIHIPTNQGLIGGVGGMGGSATAGSGVGGASAGTIASKNVDVEFNTLEARNLCKQCVSEFHRLFRLESALTKTDRLKYQELSKNQELNMLYHELVKTGLLSEDEFWETRMHLLKEDGRSVSKTLGPKNALDTILDPNQPTWNLNRQIIRQIFIEYPGAQEAFQKKVPNEMTEEQFWEKFRTSYYFHKTRAAKADTTKADIFKPYEKADEKQAQEELKAVAVEKFVDLTRDETLGIGYGVKPDELTAPAPKMAENKLLHHLNLTSARVMRDYLGEKKKAVPDQPNISDAISGEVVSGTNDPMSQARKHTIMDDLMIENESQTLIPLKIQDKHRYFEGLLSDNTKQNATGLGSTQVNLSCTQTEMLDMFRTEVDMLMFESDSFRNSLVPNDLASTIAGEIINLITQNDVTIAEYNDQSLSPDFLSKFKTTYALVNEILRHVWGLLSTTTKQWNDNASFRTKTESLIAMLQGHRKKLYSFQETYPNHQTKQLTNALIESIDVANEMYQRRNAVPAPRAGIAQSSPLQRPVLGTPGSAGRPTIQPIAIGTPGTPVNKPTLSFSLKPSPGLGVRSPLQAQQPIANNNDEEDEEDDVFSRPNKRMREA